MAPASKPATPPARPAHGMASRDKFFAAVRPLFGTITKAQVEGIKPSLPRLPLLPRRSHVAYGLGTSFAETGEKLQPVEEIGRGRGKAYGKPGKHRGQITYGRGDVQLSWD